jgi:shikimate kinase
VKIFLIGFMGCGKTTVGRLLADRLGIPFYDLDQLIEAAEGSSIREIFERSGEAAFRQVERDLLRQTRFLSDGVIATGGGTFAFDDNVLFVKSEGLSVHLSVPFDVIERRLADKAPTRPLFRDSEAALKLFQYRSKYYRMADRTLEVSEAETPDRIVDRLIDELSRDNLLPRNDQHENPGHQ